MKHIPNIIFLWIRLDKIDAEFCKNMKINCGIASKALNHRIGRCQCMRWVLVWHTVLGWDQQSAGTLDSACYLAGVLGILRMQNEKYIIMIWHNMKMIISDRVVYTWLSIGVHLVEITIPKSAKGVFWTWYDDGSFWCLIRIRSMGYNYNGRLVEWLKMLVLKVRPCGFLYRVVHRQLPWINWG